MASIHEFNQFWQQLTAHFPPKGGLDPKLLGAEYFKFLRDFSGDVLLSAYGKLVETRKLRSLPPVAEIRQVAEGFAGRKSDKPGTWAEMEAIWTGRWREADAILDRLVASDACWQIREAKALGFEGEYRRVARRAIWERLRDGHEPGRLPLLSFGGPERPGMYDHLRARALGGPGCPLTRISGMGVAQAPGPKRSRCTELLEAPGALLSDA